MRRRKGQSPGRNQRPAQALPARATPNAKTPFQREQTTKRRGEISELAFALAAARQGFGISRPYGDSERYDIILDSSHISPVIPNRAQGAEEPALFVHPPAPGPRPGQIFHPTPVRPLPRQRPPPHQRTRRPLHPRRNRFLRCLRNPRRLLVHLPPNPHPRRNRRNPKPQTPPQTPYQQPLPRSLAPAPPTRRPRIRVANGERAPPPVAFEAMQLAGSSTNEAAPPFAVFERWAPRTSSSSRFIAQTR
jgi:hypothetical protein